MSKNKDAYLVKIIDHESGETLVHIRNIGPTDHSSVCGMDGGVAGSEQEIVPLKRGDKMNCSRCKVYYENRQGLSLNKAWLES